ncbi:MAG TPA: cytochrome c biogenesis heme-transporting ATPase CcmA [Burkholderiales bacterium]|jgi:heme exporter protein A|nr:cytochrome c biogenesis heme-transporting ATPase CcmA [Burkholderiales bacterium]
MLEAAELECERGARTLFRAVSFVLAQGELLRVAGANGSGKTSLLRILCGLARPSAGEVRWKGQPIASLKEDYARELVYIGHAPAVKDDLTPRENLEIACRLSGRPARSEALAEALARLRVPDLPVRKLSQGQRRRAALARLLVSEAPLWLLDEPFATLDAQGISLLNDLLEKQVEGGGAVVYTTHQEAGIRSTRVVDLGRGA